MIFRAKLTSDKRERERERRLCTLYVVYTVCVVCIVCRCIAMSFTSPLGCDGLTLTLASAWALVGSRI